VREVHAPQPLFDAEFDRLREFSSVLAIIRRTIRCVQLHRCWRSPVISHQMKMSKGALAEIGTIPMIASPTQTRIRASR
jgi:hypothetical protein